MTSVAQPNETGMVRTPQPREGDSPLTASVEAASILGAVLGTGLGAAIGVVFGRIAVWATIGAMGGLILGAWNPRIFPQWRYLIGAVGLPMATLAFSFLAWSRNTTDNWWQQVLISLAGTWIGVLVTVFYVEVVLSRHEQRRLEPLARLAQYRVRSEAAQFVAAYAVFAGLDIPGSTIAQGDSGGIDLTDKGDELLRALMAHVPRTFELAGPEHWRAMGKLLGEGANQHTQTIVLFGQAMDPDTASKVATLQMLSQSLSDYIPADLQRYGNDPPKLKTKMMDYQGHVTRILQICHQLLGG